jgi:glycosyltransferase involved in cell wall biosynthesis
MKVLQVYNQYRSLHGGEENVVNMTAELLERRGNSQSLMMRTSRGLDRGFRGKVLAFASGIYSRSAYHEIATLLEADRPDVVHAHNIYPLISPSILIACRRAGVPVVLSTHNYLLTCPTTHHLRNGKVCESCSGGKEHWCLLKNCRQNLFESAAYGARSWIARRRRWFHDNVALFIVLTRFGKQKLVAAGYDPERICVLPNMVDLDSPQSDCREGRYVAFSGRMSAEKGIDTLLRAAKRLPEVPFRLAGDGPLLDDLRSLAPANVEFLGRLDMPQMAAFYRDARFLVVPSKWYEGCPLVVSEAMSHGIPVVASRIGGLPELIDEGTTGLLFQTGEDEELASEVKSLWNAPDRCGDMGMAGREKAEREYGEDTYYQRLMSAYEHAMALNRQGEGRLATFRATTSTAT